MALCLNVKARHKISVLDRHMQDFQQHLYPPDWVVESPKHFLFQDPIDGAHDSRGRYHVEGDGQQER